MSTSYCEQDSIEFRQLKTKNPAIYGNPVWTNFPGEVAGVDCEPEVLFKLRELYAMADNEAAGYLGRPQFKNLMEMIGLKEMVPSEASNDPEKLQKLLMDMFDDMDADGNGQIEFDEFVAAMVLHLGDQLSVIGGVEPGAMGTTMWSRGAIIWGANTGLILITAGLGTGALVYFQFILIPVIMSYFFTFLVAPLMDLFEHRPLECGSLSCCEPMEPDPDGEEGDTRFINEARRDMEGPKASCYDLFTLGRVPHGLSVLGCIGFMVGGFILVCIMISNEVSALQEDKVFMDALADKVDSAYESLNSSGIKILRNDSPDGYTEADLSGLGDTLNALVGLVGLIFLLTVYIMSEKVDSDLFHDNIILEEIEAQVKYYIVLKTAISLLTGVIVGVILLVLQVKLALMFGLLSFLFNYIPNVGSMVAMMLPIPIVLVDPAMATWQQVGAFVGPGIVQGYVGNVLEPVLFGKSLNMTPLSILAALAIWGSIWGLMGAVLSVPLLAVQKICLMHCNHPLAKSFLMCIREDATIDEMSESDMGIMNTADAGFVAGGSGPDTGSE